MKSRNSFIVGHMLMIVGSFFMMLAVFNGWHMAIRWLSFSVELVALLIIYSARKCPFCYGFNSLRGRWSGKEMVCIKCHKTVQIKWRREIPDRYKCTNVDPRK